MQIARIEPDQRGAQLDPVALVDQDLGHHAAIGMLHHLAVAVDLDAARRDDRAGRSG